MDGATFRERCRDLAPLLSEHAGEGERARRVPDAVVAEARAADLLGAVVPTSLGGHGLTLGALAHGTRELAHGCPASAWTLSFLMLHGWMLSRFPVGSHEALFAAGPPTAAAPLAPTGTLDAVAGGYRVTGRWEWATAIDHSDWCIVHGIDTAAGLATRFAVVPITEVVVEDTWSTSGMRATGSHTVVVDGVLVPEERTCPGDLLREPAGGLAGDGLAGLPLLSVLALVASAPALGAAQAAVAHHRDRLAERVLAYTLGDRAADQPLAQARLAAVTSQVETAAAGWTGTIDELTAAATGPPDDLLRARARLAAAAAVRASRLAIGAIGEGAGASVYATGQPLQRLQRDVETLKGHVIFDWDRTTELAGRVMLGRPLGPLDMA